MRWEIHYNVEYKHSTEITHKCPNEALKKRKAKRGEKKFINKLNIRIMITIIILAIIGAIIGVIASYDGLDYLEDIFLYLLNAILGALIGGLIGFFYCVGNTK